MSTETYNGEIFDKAVFERDVLRVRMMSDSKKKRVAEKNLELLKGKRQDQVIGARYWSAGNTEGNFLVRVVVVPWLYTDYYLEKEQDRLRQECRNKVNKEEEKQNRKTDEKIREHEEKTAVNSDISKIDKRKIQQQKNIYRERYQARLYSAMRSKLDDYSKEADENMQQQLVEKAALVSTMKKLRGAAGYVESFQKVQMPIAHEHNFKNGYGSYRVHLDDGQKLFLDAKLLMNEWLLAGLSEDQADDEISQVAEERHSVYIEGQENKLSDDVRTTKETYNEANSNKRIDKETKKSLYEKFGRAQHKLEAFRKGIVVQAKQWREAEAHRLQEREMRKMAELEMLPQE